MCPLEYKLLFAPIGTCRELIIAEYNGLKLSLDLVTLSVYTI